LNGHFAGNSAPFRIGIRQDFLNTRLSECVLRKCCNVQQLFHVEQFERGNCAGLFGKSWLIVSCETFPFANLRIQSIAEHAGSDPFVNRHREF
jgi:hypothetical protein